MRRRRYETPEELDRAHDRYEIEQAEDAYYERRADGVPAREGDPLDRDPGDLDAMESEAEQDAGRKWPTR